MGKGNLLSLKITEKRTDMNKYFFYLAALLTILGSCQSTERQTMYIDGQISPEYDGQIMYLVPRPHATPETVDSVFIKEGSFTFSVPADSAIYDLTIGRRAKANIQRLLLVAEPGTLHVSMGTNSSATGTSLNNQLQHWKELMEAAGEKATIMKQQRDSIYQNFGDSTVCFIKQNMNPLGGYLFMTLRNMFSEQQLNELKELGIERWKTEP